MFISSFSSATVRNLKKKKKKKSEEKKIILEKDAPEEVRRRSRLTRKKPSQERSRRYSLSHSGDAEYAHKTTPVPVERRKKSEIFPISFGRRRVRS